MKWSKEALEKRRKRFYKSKLNTKVGRLEIINYKGVDESQKHLFEVKCDCGNTKTLRWNNIRKNGSTASCGCYRRECVQKRIGKNIEHLCVQNIKNSCKAISSKRNFDFDLDSEFIKENIFQNCFYCGKPPSNTFKSNNFEIRTINYNGLDRKNNSIGYIKDNVVPCCMDCNYMKREKSMEEFIEICKKIAYNND